MTGRRRAAPEVSLVIVTRNSGRHLAGLLRSLPAGCEGVRYEVVVVDNASSDDTLAAVAEHAPEATVVRMGRNAGFAAGINAGVAAMLRTSAILALNADLRMRAGAASALLAGLSRPGAGICAPRLLEPDGAVAHSLRREPTVLRALGESVLGGARAGRVALLGEVVHDDTAYGAAGEAQWATGAALLISRACWNAAGPFDESFFLYSEETDFALRAKDAGYTLRYVPDAVMEHEGGESATSPPLYALMTRNRVRLFARRHGPIRSAAFWSALALGEALRTPRHPVHRAALAALLRLRPTLEAEPAPGVVSRAVGLREAVRAL